MMFMLSQIAFIPPATAADAPTLSTQDQAALKALGIKIAVPTYVPPGYTVRKVKVEPCPAEVRVHLKERVDSVLDIASPIGMQWRKIAVFLPLKQQAAVPTFDSGSSVNMLIRPVNAGEHA
jgi:hypothetical protein